MKSRQRRDKTVEVVATSSPEASANEITTAAGAMPVEVDMNSEVRAEGARAEATTSSNASAEEESTTKNTSSVLLLYRIGEALHAAKRTHASTKQKGLGLSYNEAKVNNGIASLVQWVQSLNQDKKKVDFEGAMDRLERESKKGNPLVIDLTKPGEKGASGKDSSISSTHDSDDSDYKVGNDGSKQQHKKTASRKKLKTPDKGDSPWNENASLTMLSNVCGNIIGEESKDAKEDAKEEISVNKDNNGNNFFLADLFNTEYNDKLKDKEEKRKREQEEDQESGDASNRFDEQDDTNIDRDSADRVKNRRKKKKKKKKQSSDEEEISVNKDNAKEEISVNGDNDGNNIFLADLFNTDYNGKLKGKEKTGI